jgi:TetR/AcrR family transcriptional repressor of nem operon
VKSASRATALSASNDDDVFSFRDWVESRQREAGLRRKGERTRDRIRLAAVELLNEVGYRDMKVSDVCDRAEVSPPVMYLYFQNKLALTEDVLRDFLENFMTRSTSGSASRTPYEAIYDANLRWLASARANAGLLRCLLQVSDEVPELAELFARANHSWYARVAQSVTHRFPAAAPEQPAITLAVYALGGMMDELSRKLFAMRDPHLLALTDAVASSDEALARFLSVLWHRALYGFDPGPADDPMATPLLTKAARSRARRAPKAPA